MRRIPDLGSITSRRGALAAAAAMSALALRSEQTAGKKKSCKKKARQKVSTACAGMRDECLAHYGQHCADSSDPEACRAALTICCGSLEDCNFTEHVTCLSQAQ